MEKNGYVGLVEIHWMVPFGKVLKVQDYTEMLNHYYLIPFQFQDVFTFPNDFYPRRLQTSHPGPVQSMWFKVGLCALSPQANVAYHNVLTVANLFFRRGLGTVLSLLGRLSSLGLVNSPPSSHTAPGF